MGYQQSRLAGRPWGRDAADQHDRRRDQSVVCAFRAERLDGGKHERAGAVHEKARSATGSLHGSGSAVQDQPEKQTGRVRRNWPPVGTTTHATRQSVAGVGNRVDPGIQSAGQGPRGTGIWDCAGPAGEGLRVAGVTTLEQANHYLETEFLPWINATLAVAPASADDAHRPLEKHYDLAAILSHVENRRVNNDYTILFETKIFQIARKDICAGLRGAVVRVEKRRDGSVAVRFRDRYLSVEQCAQRTKVPVAKTAKAKRSASPVGHKEWCRNFDLKKAPKIWQATAGSVSRTEESQ